MFTSLYLRLSSALLVTIACSVTVLVAACGALGADDLNAPVFSYASELPISPAPDVSTKALKSGSEVASAPAPMDSRAFTVRLNTARFATLKIGDSFDMVLPNVGTVTALITMRETQLDTIISIAGRLVGRSDATFILSGSGDAFSGGITVGSNEWNIRATPEGATLQNESAAGMTPLPSHSPEDYKKFRESQPIAPVPTGPDGQAIRPISDAKDLHHNLLANGVTAKAANTDNTTSAAAPAETSRHSVIDLLIISDLSYQRAQGGNSAELAQLGGLIALANKALADSQVSLSYRLVGYVRGTTDLTAASQFETMNQLGSFSGAFAGYWGQRVASGADVVVAVNAFSTSKGNVCGLGNLGYFQPPNNVFSNAVPLIPIASVSVGVLADGRYCAAESLAHELGHVLGAQHDRSNATTPPAFAFSYGWGIPGVFGDIMSYLYPRKMIFSNPDLLTCPGGQCGTVQDNVARTFVATAPLVAAASDPDNRLSGWYYDPAQSGTGWAIEVVNGRAFLGGFLYRDDGQPTWVVATASPCASKPDVLCAGLDEYEGGQTLTGPYKPNRYKRRVANAELTFGAGYPATLKLVIGNVERKLQRYVFSNNGLATKPTFPGGVLPGWYLNTQAPGTGVFIERQNDEIYAAYFYYRDDGTPAWSVVSGKNWLSNGTSVSANILSFANYSNGQSLLGAYRLANVNSAAVARTYMNVDTGSFTVFNNSGARSNETWTRFAF